MWTLKMPLRIKVFCWLVIIDRIFTKENLMNKGWKNRNYASFAMISRPKSICYFCVL
jgi:hypothetical protein